MTSLNVARVRGVGDADAVRLATWESWLPAMQVYSAVFAATATDRESVTARSARRSGNWSRRDRSST
ncbi:hypothetical protein [Streptomyces sp. A1136]|uniref:hypothetical protein n=1 Tax=Streptomyces sp. A1136 TaxID=2563102 RepID=UPI001F0EFCBA|nr:hypothetical protein [Streptomyces sp. A1136]